MHPDKPARHMPALLQLSHNALHRVGRNREPDPHRPAAIRRQNGSVHPHHLAVLRKQRTAGIALVNRRVDLNEIVVRRLANIAPARTDDAGGHRAAQSERITYRHHPATGLRRIGIAQVDERQLVVGLHPQHGQIATRIAAYYLRRQRGAVIQRHAHRGRVSHHVVIRHDGAIRVDDEPRPARLDGPVLLLLHAEREWERHRPERARALAAATESLGLIVTHLAGDADHGRLHLVHQAHEIRQLMRRQGGLDGARLRGRGRRRVLRQGSQHATGGQSAERCAGQQRGDDQAAGLIAAWSGRLHGGSAIAVKGLGRRHCRHRVLLH